LAGHFSLPALARACDLSSFLLRSSRLDDSVLEQMQMAAKVKSYSDGKKIYYGVIDGQDSTRLIQAYPKAFKKK
jgi:hypothetical protein